MMAAIIPVLTVLLVTAGSLWSSDARAIDLPHTQDCGTCHDIHGPSYPSLVSQLCEGCHFEGGPAPAVATHSSLTTDNGYGNWHMDCWSCHDPHLQQQDRAYGTSYGKFLRVDLNAEVKEINPADPGPYYYPISILRTVTSSNLEHTTSTDFIDGDAQSSDDMCQVCHESTAYYNGLSALNFHTDYGPDSQPGGNCTSCHTHTGGFSPAGGGSCTGCHASAQGAGGYRRQVAGVGGDFERTSHHVTDGSTTEIVDIADCLVCHQQTQHQSNADPTVLLNDPDGGLAYTYDGTGASVEGFCLACHDVDSSTAYDSNAFAGDGNQPFSDGRTPQDIDSGWTTASHNGATSEGCLGCHGGPDSTRPTANYDRNVHGSDNPKMLSSVVNGTTLANFEEAMCNSCHDGSVAAKDVSAQFAKANRHPIDDADQSGRSVECADCHNPHEAQAGVHSYTATATAGRNQVSPVLTAVSGVAVNYSGLGNFAAVGSGSYTEVGAALYEYEICMKCHTYSYNGVNPINPNTDVAQEFNPGNASFHPVVVGLDDASSNSTSLQVDQMVGPWTSNLGTQTMMCSDCHNTDAASPAAQGPHGSAVSFMLRGPNTIWPPTQLITQDTEFNSAYNNSFCANCHQMAASGNVRDSNNRVHDKHRDRDVYCYSCHIVIPHGGKLGRLIGDRDSNMPSRYAYQNNLNNLFVQQFRKQNDYTVYDKPDCQASCTGTHSSAVGAQYNWD